jgi:hypothetical protein
MPILLDKLVELDAFDNCGRVIYPVVEDYVFRKCTDYRRYRDSTTGQIKEVGGNLTGKLVGDALLGNNSIRLAPGEVETRQRTRWLKRWEDTTPEMQAIAIQYGLKIEQKPHCQICFHIGQPLVEEALAARQPLAAFILRRLRQKMPALLGDVEFGLWFFVEQVPYKEESLHAQGLLYINDDSWFPENARKNERLRKLIRKETGDNSRVDNNWLLMRELDMDAGNIWYSTKASEKRMRSRHPAAAPVELTGSRLEARSQVMSRIGKEFYTRMRPFINALLTNQLLDWEESDWERVGVAWTRF